ncbi:hypothetical protein BXZ70DRAFT_941064 [Cristinia sonorae]|uniref:Tail specific protease domain-containing protein n=1 Tax=Cristinia sonorae TaxID=1940300 RepID=A0A8K0ULY9_9AGAR|nr:hypothetical protein BXZ70DRAFT_941064 [Cristinia sonorae]
MRSSQWRHRLRRPLVRQSTHSLRPCDADMGLKTTLGGWLLSGAVAGSLASTIAVRQDTETEGSTVDPCAAISEVEWVSPKQVRACYTYKGIQVAPIEKVKDNVLDVISQTLDQYHATYPYQNSRKLANELTRIKHSHYKNGFELHVDISQTLKRELQDGNVYYKDTCYDDNFVSYIPTPLALLQDKQGREGIYIAPDAFDVLSAAFGDEIETWQNALPGKLKGKLASLSGAKVLKINNKDPFDVVEENAKATGRYQSLGSRQKAFFASYVSDGEVNGGDVYVMGDFAQQTLPLDDSVTLTIQRNGTNLVETITLPYRARNEKGMYWSDAKHYRSRYCVAQDLDEHSNGQDIYNASPSDDSLVARAAPFSHWQNATIESRPRGGGQIPDQLDILYIWQWGPLVVRSFDLYTTGPKAAVLSLGAFTYTRNFIDYQTLRLGILNALDKIHNAGYTRLILDLSGNQGGEHCLGHFLERGLFGPKVNTPGPFDVILRAPPLAQTVVKSIAENNTDPDEWLNYNPIYFASNGAELPGNKNYLKKPEKRYINGQTVEYSPKLTPFCPPFDLYPQPPAEAYFKPKDVVILSDGKCLGACASFVHGLVKRHKVKTVVVGGKKNVQQVVGSSPGGMALDFAGVKTNIRSTGFGKHRLALPHLITDGYLGITWGAGFIGNDLLDNEVLKPDWVIQPTIDNFNSPVTIWKEIDKKFFK